MQLIIKDFDFLKFSFCGQSLIEASAGTGKTYVIVMLYLRLLLGINSEVYLESLTIEKILIVTFTRLAAEELRDRIRTNIREFKIACITRYSANPFFMSLLKEIGDIDLAYQKLLVAEHKIDQASIFTIHSFCQHILNMCPIELDSVFRYSILENNDSLVQEACNNFWRKYFYHLSAEILNIIQGYWRNPQYLLKEIYPYLYNLDINIQPILIGDFVTQHKSIIAYINYIKKIWLVAEDALLNFMYSTCCLNRRIYSVSNISTWFKIINSWAKEMTVDYKISNVLYRFQYSMIINHINSHDDQISQYFFLFKLIDMLFKKTVSLKQLILSTAIHEIRKNIKFIKEQFSLVSFDDLISLLDNALHYHKGKKELLEWIRAIYPVAIIDEFQDTNFQQYRIFHTLYSSLSQSKYGLLLIGDPKQSIYSFRGADIFSYLSARKKVDFYYTLKINWRTSESMVNAINTLFQSTSSCSPFVFHEIPFIPIHSAKNNNKLCLIVKDKIYPALSFWLPSCDQLTMSDYKKILAFQCATTIRDLLHDANHGHVWLQIDIKNKKLLQLSDMVILVRDRYEGHLISSVLNNMNISNIYLSDHGNIFHSLEAFDILLILQAVLVPEDNNALRCALMTNIIGYDSKKIDFINQNADSWKKEVEEFVNYYLFWKKYGVQSMLQEIIRYRGISQRLLVTEVGKISLVNILHLSEILQKNSMQLHDESALLNWLRIKINSHDLNCNDQLLRLTSNYPLIKIMTIHKSKGLEFPLVFIPFIADIHKSKYPLFHDRQDHHLYLDLSSSLHSINLSNEERLSEDLRLLYVAVTRAIYHCFIGIGAIFFKKRNNIKKKYCSDLHSTALGYLVQDGIPGDFKFLEQCLIKLVKSTQGNIVLNHIPVVINQKKDYISLPDISEKIDSNYIKQQTKLSARDWKSVDFQYTVTSYSELCRFNIHSTSSHDLKFNNVKDIILTQRNSKKHDTIFTPCTFPQGKQSGILLHYILQKWNFKEKINDEWLLSQFSKYNINQIWLPVVQTWIYEVASISLNSEELMLSKLSFADYITEFQFYISINNLVHIQEFNNLCKKYDSLSRASSSFTFPNILGMLHGFVDLVFRWKEKYYLLDYKSNWLGYSYHDYSESAVRNEMILHHYALQYQIYTLALHRFLRHRLISYDYKKYFGGIFYLFLRGMNLTHPGYGIYFYRPDQILINKLDKLLS